jgi:S-adenosylmethionine-diacylglycerol 3-amino-3-carboxypropyl transferase
VSDLHFAQIREDSWLERELVEAARPRRSAVIASGGCTALSLLDDGAEQVLAVDASPAQCALVALRKAAIRALDRDAYLAFIGERPSTTRLETYCALARTLPAEVQRFWDAHHDLLREGVQHAGTTERFYRYVASHLRDLLGEARLEQLLVAPSLDAQRVLYRQLFEGEAVRAALRVLLAKSTHLLFFPAFMFEHAEEHDFAAFFLAQFEHELTTKPVAGNYFLSQLLFGRYVEGHARGLPPYLTPEGYARTQRNLDKLEVRCAPLHVALESVRSVDAFFLSNVFDWCTPELMAASARAILQSARSGALVLHRNMLSARPLPAELAARYAHDVDRSRLLHARERSFLYRNVQLGRLA